MNVHGRWDEPGDDQACIDWARQLYRDTLPYASAGAYINFMTSDEDERIIQAFGDNYQRLRAAKQHYDPDNVFHLNQNIAPLG